MNIKYMLFSVFVLLNIIIFFITDIDKENKIENALNEHVERLKIDYNTLKYHQKLTVHTVNQSVQPIAVKILSKLKNSTKEEEVKIRKELYDALSNKYKVMKKRGVYQFHFVLPNNKTFLRVHKPGKFGDDLSKVRYTYKYTNETKKPIEGFEGGKTAHGYRYVTPIFDNNKNYLCAMEVSYSSDYLQNYLRDVSKLHTHFIINKNVFESEIWERDDIKLKYKQSAENDDFMVMTRSDKDEAFNSKAQKKLLHKKEWIKEKMNMQKPFTLYIKPEEFHSTNPEEKHMDVVSFLPIKSSTNENLAWLIAHTTDKNIDSIMYSTKLLRAILFILLTISFYFLYTILNKKEELAEQVKEKTKELEELNKNLEQKIEEEVEKNRQKELQLLEKSKMSALGEMIGNIAHQWRQPLNVISTSSSALQIKQSLGSLNNETLKELTERINTNTQYLSDTINTFRSFLKDNKEEKNVVVQKVLKDSINIVDATLKSSYIDLYHNLNGMENINLTLVEGELNQVIINIINNAKDILLEKKPETPWIKLNLTKDKDTILISIEDNGGGIPEDIMGKIFEPYFTTKHQSQGTGLGLHMSYKIINESLKGKLYVKNTQNGAKFHIELPFKD